MISRLRRWLCAAGSRQDRLRDPDAVIAALEVRPGMAVADLGPGVGHFTLPLARAVEPEGVVYALDTNRRTLGELRGLADEREITTLRAVPVPRDRLDVPGPVDLLFVSATYHHLPHPAWYFGEARTHLQPGGRVAILESRREGMLARWLAPHAGRAARPSRRARDHDAAGSSRAPRPSRRPRLKSPSSG